jgi:hypothetical protein
VLQEDSQFRVAAEFRDSWSQDVLMRDWGASNWPDGPRPGQCVANPNPFPHQMLLLHRPWWQLPHKTAAQGAA